MVQQEDGLSPVLTEVLADSEFQLQEIVKENPDLLPIDEFGITGPLMVVGRETTLPSGAVDLLCLAQDGELFLIEFKTGPQNSDFRRVLAQLLDYGSDLWRMSYEEFESTVTSRYFSSNHCRDERLRGKASLDEAIYEFWPDLQEEEDSVRENLSQRLDAGAFHYVVVAQRFTQGTEKTIEYLNAATSEARFYAVELVRFAAEGLSAFEARTVLKPETQSLGSKQKEATSQARFLGQIVDDTYRKTLQELLEVCRGLGLHVLARFARGPSIRLPVQGRSEKVSIGWVFPPGVSGWMGLTDLTLGFNPKDVEKLPAAPAFENYVRKVGELPDVEPVDRDWLRAYRLSPETVIRHRRQIAEILAELAREASG